MTTSSNNGLGGTGIGTGGTNGASRSPLTQGYDASRQRGLGSQMRQQGSGPPVVTSGQGRSLGTVPGTINETSVFDAPILAAAEKVLRDPQRLDPQWRDPISPATERNAAVVQALTQAVVEARRGTAPDIAALAQVGATDEATLLALYDHVVGWGSLQTYFDMPDVTEIKIIGRYALIMAAGSKPVTVLSPLTVQEADTRARLLAADANQPVNNAEPTRSLALGHGTRLSMVLAPRALEPLLVFRRGRTSAWRLENLVLSGTLNQEVADLIRFLLHLRLSVITVGATGSGKTATLETLLDAVDGHIISIEDGAQEINLRPEKLWTRQVVDVAAKREDLTDALVAVLRQTPDAVAVGECRGREAGSILSLAMTDHQVFFTIHAENAEGALRRFATLATIGGSDYAGRFDDALVDAVSSLSLIVVVQYWGHIGRRVITEVALAATVRRDDIGTLQPVVLPLATIRVDRATSTVGWDVLAQPTESGDGLVFTNGTTMPDGLRRKLEQNAQRAWSDGDSGQTPFARVLESVGRAYALLDSGNPERALAETQRAWSIRQDNARILPLVHRALSLLPLQAELWSAEAHRLHDHAYTAIQSANWDTLRDVHQRAVGNPLLMAYPPPQSWEAWLTRATTGMGYWTAFDTTCARIGMRIQTGAARESLTELDAVPAIWLDRGRQGIRLEARLTLLEALFASGQADADSVASAQRQVALWQADRHPPVALDAPAAPINAVTVRPDQANHPTLPLYLPVDDDRR